MVYIVVINVIALIVCMADKLKAKRGAWRIPEAVLMALGVVGGSVGMLCGMLLFHHKTRKPKFIIGIPVIIILQIALAAFLYFRGII